jgi:hypothetical protein
MIATTDTPPMQQLRISDPMLPILVSQATLELDRASRTSQGSLDHTNDFLHLLRNSLSEQIDTGEGKTRWLDPETVDVFGDALVETGRAGDLRTVQDVLREAQLMLESLGEEAKLEPEPRVEQLHRFCVAFGNSLLAHRAKQLPEPPSNPYRR